MVGVTEHRTAPSKGTMRGQGLPAAGFVEGRGVEGEV